MAGPVACLLRLWRGLATTLRRTGKRYLFGCCSLTSQDPADGKRVMDYLEHNDHVSPDLLVQPQPGYHCYNDDFEAGAGDPEVKVPKLMKVYLAYGTVICGPPAIDRAFKTIDYFALMDIESLDEKTKQFFYG